MNRGLNFSLGGGKYGRRKAGQQGLLFHINKPYAGQLFVLFFGAFSGEKALKFVPFPSDFALVAMGTVARGVSVTARRVPSELRVMRCDAPH